LTVKKSSRQTVARLVVYELFISPMNIRSHLARLVLLTLPLSLAGAAQKIDLDTARDLLTPTSEQMKSFGPWLKMRKSQLDHGGARIVQTSMGPIQFKRRGSGPPVICLHGGFGGYDQSWLMGSFLVDKGFSVIAVSRPGYLGTPISVGSSIEQQADATVALMDALGLQKATIYGFSAGSLVAFQVGVRHPERCSSVVLTGVGLQENQAPGYTLIDLFLKNNMGVDVPPYGLYLLMQTDFPLVLEIMMAVDSQIKGKSYDKRLAYVLSHKSQLEFARALALSLTPFSDRRKGLEADVEAVATWPDYEAAGDFAKFQPPLLFVDAKHDNSGSYPQTRAIASKIATARLISVEDSGHFIWLGPHTAKWQGQMANYIRRHQP
jgi:pimeloyl-ACP methyl ester carboxylesterase